MEKWSNYDKKREEISWYIDKWFARFFAALA